MILDFIRDNLSGDTWEKWCDDIYRDKYQDYNFIKIPSSHQGDAGIEGFTNNGIVYQCYCPEKNYTDDQLYEHLRNKVTKDINKLVDKEYAKKLSNLGVSLIKEWHFVIPEYRDKRIIEHLKKKREEVQAIRSNEPIIYSYIDPNIQIVPKTAEDFKVEFIRLIRNPLVDLKLNIAVKSIKDIDWTICKADKLENIKRKMKAIMNKDENDSDFKEMIKFWAEAYLKGIEIMNVLQKSYRSIYEDLYELEKQYEMDVFEKSRMNNDHSLNNQIFHEILNDFEKVINEQFTYFSSASAKELKRDIVSGWLANCSLEFRVVN